MKFSIFKFIFRIYFGKLKESIDEFNFIDKYLKKRGYNNYGCVYTKGFVVIDIKLKGKHIDYIEVFIDKASKSKQVISENFTTGLVISEKYFSRI